MKRLIFATMLLTGFFFAHSQGTDNDEYELKPGEKMGYIITQKDEKIEGIVKLAGDGQNPWDNQKKVKFIAKSDIDPSAKKQHFKVMDAKDIKEYIAIGDDGSERKFKEVKYTNKREGLTNAGGGLGGKIKTIKNLSSTTHLAEVVVEGKVSVYKLYGYPSPVAAGTEADIEEYNRDNENLRHYPSYIFQKEDGKVRELTVEDIKDAVEDCKIVSDKMESGVYTSYDPEKDGKKKSGMGKLMKNEVNRAGDKLPVMSKEIFSDYNANCGAK